MVHFPCEMTRGPINGDDECCNLPAARADNESDALDASSGTVGLCTNRVKTIHDVVCAAPTRSGCHRKLHGAISRGKQGRVPASGSLHMHA